ncbi:MAG: hypothetical protein ACYDHN_15085 [Solirubrobacteraceae bacterium]
MSNQAGQAYAFMAITPILSGREAQLRAYLEAFTQATSPFARLTQTHFARWVILSDWVDDSSQPHKDHLDSEYLIFTSNLDGPLEPYLDELCGLPEAEAVWSHCAGSPTPAAGAPLKAYLLHNQIDIGFFVAAYDNASVAKVTASLALREQLISFAVRSQGMDPPTLQSAFRTEFTR